MKTRMNFFEKGQSAMQAMFALGKHLSKSTLNRTFALAKSHGKQTAIAEAEKLTLDGHPLYHSLLGYLYSETDSEKAKSHYQNAIALSGSPSQRKLLEDAIDKLN